MKKLLFNGIWVYVPRLYKRHWVFILFPFVFVMSPYIRHNVLKRNYIRVRLFQQFELLCIALFAYLLFAMIYKLWLILLPLFLLPFGLGLVFSIMTDLDILRNDPMEREASFMCSSDYYIIERHPFNWISYIKFGRKQL